MILVYHATRAETLAEIKKNGLTPRGTARKGNFGIDYASRPEFVYLTRYKARNYALTAARFPRDRVALLEIVLDDLDRKKCFPDEDSIVFDKMIGEGTFEGPSHESRFAELLLDANPLEFGVEFERLFEQFGLVAYHGVVPFSTMRRYVVVPFHAVRAFADTLNPFQPAQDNVPGHRQFGSDSVRFLFDGGDIEGVSRRALRELAALRKGFKVYAGPRSGPQ